MATINDNSITVGGARDLLKASVKMQTEVLNNDFFTPLKRFGVINYEEKLTANSGTSVTMYNTPRADGLGVTGDADLYTNAVGVTSGDRTLSIRRHSFPFRYALEGSERQQISEFNLKARVPMLAKQKTESLMVYQALNQLTGNTATTLSAPQVDSTAATSAADKLILTGHNAAIAPSAAYKAYGNLAAGGISADESVDSDNTLTMADFMAAREVITGTSLGVPTWSTIQTAVEGIKVDAIALVSTTGMNQLKNDPVTQGQGLNLAQYMYAAIAGGKKLILPGNTIIFENIAFMEIPDHFLARGVNSSSGAAVANTRRAVLVGANALDFALGKGFSYNGVTVPGFSIETDEERDKLNKQGYLSAGINCGFKKTQISGIGANASTSYDNSTYVITHYSRT